MTQVHDFHKQLEYSELASCEPFWDAVYRKAFPNLVNHMPCPGDTTSQRMGIDRLLMLSNGFTIAIDEKKRRDDYGDICLEYRHLHNDGSTSPGWMNKDLSIDYLAYAIMTTKKCYLLPWQTLKRAWDANNSEWIELGRQTYQARKLAKKNGGTYHRNGFDISDAPNKNYVTYSLCIKPKILFAALQEFSIIDVSSDLVDWNYEEKPQENNGKYN